MRNTTPENEKATAPVPAVGAAGESPDCWRNQGDIKALTHKQIRYRRFGVCAVYF